MQGIIWQLNVKGETPGERGLPKYSEHALDVTVQGAAGDFNRYRHEKKADDPDQALLIMPLEMLTQLNAEGWPVKPGDIGENITTKGIPYDAFAPGRKYRAGTVEFEVSKAAAPCTHLYLLPYVGREKGPDFLKAMVGRRGWYARVLKPGTVRNGDVIEETQA
jgi:MOSC domain-containing protein YiiM